MPDNLRELIEATSVELGLRESVIEKDYYITQAIQALSSVGHPFFRLIFQGGTCLAKCHRLVQRMSEDSDFRMEAKPATNALSREAARRELRNFRHAILAALQRADFVIDDDQVRTRNEGQFMTIRLADLVTQGARWGFQLNAIRITAIMNANSLRLFE